MPESPRTWNTNPHMISTLPEITELLCGFDNPEWKKNTGNIKVKKSINRLMQAQDYYTFASHILPSWIWLKVFSVLTMISSSHIIKIVKIKAMSLFFLFLHVKKVSENRRDAHLVGLPYREAILEPWSIHENVNQIWSPLVPTNAVFILGGFFWFVLLCFHRWTSSEQKQWCIRIDLLCDCKVNTGLLLPSSRRFTGF